MTQIQAAWLQHHSDLHGLPETALEALVEILDDQTVLADHVLGREGCPIDQFMILWEGRLESYCHQPSTQTWATSLLPGAVIYLEELLTEQVAHCTILTLTDVKLKVVSVELFRQWLQQFPAVMSRLSQQRHPTVISLAAQLNYEQDRQAALLPYRVPKVERGIVGTSTYAVRLRQAIKQAASDRGSVLVFGEPGLEKDNCCALIHFSSAERREPLIKINCRQLQASGADLFGRLGGKPGLLEWLGSGTLILNNIQELPQGLKPKVLQLLETGTYTPIPRSIDDGAVTPKPCSARMMMISERSIPELTSDLVAHKIKVPPLRVRKADIKIQTEYYLNLYTRSRNIPRPALTLEALRRLQSYDFPGNLRELRSLVERAVLQVGDCSELTEEVLWASTQRKDRLFRFNLLNAYPSLRRFLRSTWWPDWINYGLVAPLFAVVVALLFWGPQTRDANVGLNLFWAWWWPVILILFPFLGRIWCAVCPFMIYGDMVQKLSLKLVPRSLYRWPRPLADQWGGWFLVGLFALIFLWEELWDLQNTAYLSAWLLLLITGGAVIGSVIYERRFWCRYLCPIGGMNGLYAKLSITELRAQRGTCSAECSTYQCYKGGPEKGEGQASDGCPLYSHPAQLHDNKDCVLCMTCLKACPHRSVELNLRPPAIDLWTTHQPQASEVALLLLLLGGVYLHRLPDIQDRWSLALSLDRFWTHAGVSVLTLMLPALIPWGAYQLYQWQCHRDLTKPKPFLELVYGYLPLILGGTLAHYLQLGLVEAGQVLPVTWATLGMSGTHLPVVIADQSVITFLQGVTLLLAGFLSVILTQQMAKQPLRILWPQSVGIGFIGFTLWILTIK